MSSNGDDTSSRPLRGKDDALIVSIVKEEGERSFRSAGTGLHSLSWVETQQFTYGNNTDFDENLALQWKGSPLSTSEFANHIMIQPDEAPVALLEAVERVLSGRRRRQPLEPVTKLTAEELIGMGAVWFLPAGALLDPTRGEKPERLTAVNGTSLLLEEGDYIRIHHYPRRFSVCADYDWCRYIDSVNDSEKPGVIVAQDDEKGWIAVDKPAMVPVHMTVDNSQENVAACLQLAIMRTATTSSTSTTTEPPAPPPFVSTPQRLDQNTSGLLVAASSKIFAAYFAKLLSTKTEQQLGDSKIASLGGIHKYYRCLVCVQPPTPSPAVDDGSNIVDDGSTNRASSWTAKQGVTQLETFAAEGTIVRHYLEPSAVCGPKRFVEKLPEDATKKKWPECLLKIRSVGKVCSLLGSQAGGDLAHALWDNPDYITSESAEHRIPTDCQAVVEVEIELLTGRTHQIRGQLSTLGFSLVGDARYGGALPANYTSAGSEKVALQCCELEFLDPDIIVKEDGVLFMKQSERWNRFRLERAWWTPLLQQYQEKTNADVTINSPQLASTS
jgi:23S rRNA-/tRNA-specific pseudouridylate synthase